MFLTLIEENSYIKDMYAKNKTNSFKLITVLKKDI